MKPVGVGTLDAETRCTVTASDAPDSIRPVEPELDVVALIPHQACDRKFVFVVCMGAAIRAIRYIGPAVWCRPRAMMSMSACTALGT